MTKENHGPYEFLGSMVVNLMNIDKSISYSFLEDELHISGRDVSAMRQGKDLHVYQYVRVVSCIMDEIHLEILLNALLKELKNVFAAHCDLVIGTIPHRLYGNGQPAEWVVVMRWDGVGVCSFLSYPDCYLSLLKYVRIFFMILIPKTTPSKMAMPVLNERMSESALLAAGARGENISRVVAVIALF